MDFFFFVSSSSSFHSRCSLCIPYKNLNSAPTHRFNPISISIMSIVALKRKTHAKYHNMSVGQPHFSLNGTHRSQGFVGQTSLSRSLSRTLMRGNTICGHGGYQGTYPVQSFLHTEGTGIGSNALNNPTVVKSSVLDTTGQLATRYRWIRRPQPYTSVKPDTTLNLGTQQDHIAWLKRRTLAKIAEANHRAGTVNNNITNLTNRTCCPYMKTNYTTYHTMGTKPYTIAKPDKVMSQSEHLIHTMNKNCSQLDCIKYVRPTGHHSFACNHVV